MNLLDKIKLLFQGDPEPETEAAAAPAGEQTAQPEAEKTPEPKAEPKAESKAEKKAAEKPKAAEKKPAPEPEEEKARPKGNYLENKSKAVLAICNHLYKYAYSNRRDLAVLEVWIVNPEETEILDYNDPEFMKDLESALAQEQITGVRRINHNAPVSMAEIRAMQAKDGKIEAVIEGEIYCKLHAIEHSAKAESAVKAPEAWLVCVLGDEMVQTKVYHLDPTKKTSWHIGRCERISPFSINDIVILPECTTISREQARLLVEDGKYFLQRKERGSRTKILRASGEEEELFTTEPRELKWLDEGDHININKQIYYRFTYINPENA